MLVSTVLRERFTGAMKDPSKTKEQRREEAEERAAKRGISLRYTEPGHKTNVGDPDHTGGVKLNVAAAFKTAVKGR